MLAMKIHVQLTRYAVVGLASNAAGYLLYLLITSLGMGHKTAMTLLYVSGVLLTFIFNKSWSFNHDGAMHGALVRYIAAYAFGYVLNLAGLMLMADHWGLPHQWVQGGMIFVVAGTLFLLHRYWVFAGGGIEAAKRVT